MAKNIVKDSLSPRLDIPSDTIMYVGLAAPDADPAGAVWKIIRITSDVNGGLVGEWADGNTEFDNIWDNRASLSYS